MTLWGHRQRTRTRRSSLGTRGAQLTKPLAKEGRFSRRYRTFSARTTEGRSELCIICGHICAARTLSTVHRKLVGSFKRMGRPFRKSYVWMALPRAAGGGRLHFDLYSTLKMKHFDVCGGFSGVCNSSLAESAAVNVAKSSKMAPGPHLQSISKETALGATGLKVY
jgi:hypothetical protein